MFAEFDIAQYISRAVIVVPIILGVTEVFKTFLPTKYAPLISLGLGIGVAFMISPAVLVGHNIVAGVIYGLSASGLYSGARTIINPTPPQEESKKERDDIDAV
jgi:hypothetical protein